MTDALHPRLASLLAQLDQGAPTNIGYPVARDVDYRPLAPFLGYLLNNIGDPRVDPTFPAHVKDLEREVVSFFAQLFGAGPERYGYVTSGGSESTLYALSVARDLHPTGIVYHSRAAHYSVTKAADLLGLPRVPIAVTGDDEMDYGDLYRHAEAYRGRPAIVVASVGTTMTEAADNVKRIREALDLAGVRDIYLHSDAALSGIPLALNHRTGPAFDLTAGADSVAISGHKFLGTPIACGVVVGSHLPGGRDPVAYLGSPDNTISGSRSGLAALMLWHAITTQGYAGMRSRAAHARALAAETVVRLRAAGWSARRAKHAMTVVIDPLPEALRQRWPLPIAGGRSHVITMPGVQRSSIDALLSDLAAHGARPVEILCR